MKEVLLDYAEHCTCISEGFLSLQALTTHGRRRHHVFADIITILSAAIFTVMVILVYQAGVYSFEHNDQIYLKCLFLATL